LNAGAGAVYDFGKKIKARLLRIPESKAPSEIGLSSSLTL
jgi:hypothetical protein